MSGVSAERRAPHQRCNSYGRRQDVGKPEWQKSSLGGLGWAVQQREINPL